MGRLPTLVLVHTVTVEPFTGEGPFGPTYGPAADVRCFVDEGRRMVRGPDGTEVISQATVYALPGTSCPAGSRVTLPSGRVATALAVASRDGGGLPTPDHVEVSVT